MKSLLPAAEVDGEEQRSSQNLHTCAEGSTAMSPALPSSVSTRRQYVEVRSPSCHHAESKIVTSPASSETAEDDYSQASDSESPAGSSTQSDSESSEGSPSKVTEHRRFIEVPGLGLYDITNLPLRFSTEEYVDMARLDKGREPLNGYFDYEELRDNFEAAGGQPPAEGWRRIRMKDIVLEGDDGNVGGGKEEREGEGKGDRSNMTGETPYSIKLPFGKMVKRAWGLGRLTGSPERMERQGSEAEDQEPLATGVRRRVSYATTVRNKIGLSGSSDAEGREPVRAKTTREISVSDQDTDEEDDEGGDANFFTNKKDLEKQKVGKRKAAARKAKPRSQPKASKKAKLDADVSSNVQSTSTGSTTEKKQSSKPPPARAQSKTPKPTAKTRTSIVKKTSATPNPAPPTKTPAKVQKRKRATTPKPKSEEPGVNPYAKTYLTGGTTRRGRRGRAGTVEGDEEGLQSLPY